MMNVILYLLAFIGASHIYSVARKSYRKVGCVRCAELAAGKAARSGWGFDHKADDARLAREIREHDCAKRGCGIVCTHGEW
jgi:hypothetical protein